MVSKLMIFGAFLFLISLFFYILGAFLIKQLFHFVLVEYEIGYSQLGPAISYPTRAHGMIVKYLITIIRY